MVDPSDLFLDTDGWSGRFVYSEYTGKMVIDNGGEGFSRIQSVAIGPE
jgi:hypothetical protein